MKNEMMNNEMSSVGTRRLRLPLQAAPVERTLAAAPALAGQEGVVPSFDLGGFLKQALPYVAQGLSLLA
jgi:hypothetical protein